MSRSFCWGQQHCQLHCAVTNFRTRLYSVHRTHGNHVLHKGLYHSVEPQQGGMAVAGGPVTQSRTSSAPCPPTIPLPALLHLHGCYQQRHHFLLNDRSRILVTHICNLSTQEAEAWHSQIQGQRRFQPTISKQPTVTFPIPEKCYEFFFITKSLQKACNGGTHLQSS